MHWQKLRSHHQRWPGRKLRRTNCRKYRKNYSTNHSKTKTKRKKKLREKLLKQWAWVDRITLVMMVVIKKIMMHSVELMRISTWMRDFSERSWRLDPSISIWITIQIAARISKSSYLESFTSALDCSTQVYFSTSCQWSAFIRPFGSATSLVTNLLSIDKTFVHLASSRTKSLRPILSVAWNN